MKIRNKVKNPIIKEFLDLNLINKKNFIQFHDKTRDAKIHVLQDAISKVIFLKDNIINDNHYKFKNNQSITSFNETSRKKIKNKTYSLIKINKKKIKSKILNDHSRRFKDWKKYIKNKSILDYGCGTGGFIVKSLKIAKKCSAVELNQKYIDQLKDKINIKNNIEKFSEKFCTITSCHVFEHLPHQVETIKKLKKKLKPNGNLIIEVPCAHDFLLKFDQLPEFKDFTMWSEHIILHTEDSLRTVLRKAGFKTIKIKYFQRYNFANHFGWFKDKKPGGHEIYSKMFSNKINKTYKKFLEDQKTSDTLIAVASNR